MDKMRPKSFKLVESLKWKFLLVTFLLLFHSAFSDSVEDNNNNYYSSDISEEPQKVYRVSSSSKIRSRSTIEHILGYRYPSPPPPPTTTTTAKPPCKTHHHPPEPACGSIIIPTKVKTNYQEKEVLVPEFTRVPVDTPEFVPREVEDFDFQDVPFPVIKYERNHHKNITVDRWEIWPKEKIVKKRVPVFKNDTVHFNIYKLRPRKYIKTELRPRNIEVTEEVEQEISINFVDTQIEYETVWLEEEVIVFNDTYLDLVVYDYVEFDVEVEKVRYFDKAIPVDNYTIVQKKLKQRRLEYEEERDVEIDDIWYGKKPIHLPKVHIHHEQLIEERIQFTNNHTYNVPVFEPYEVKVPIFTNYSVDVPRFYPVEVTIPTYTKMPCAKISRKTNAYLPPLLECPECPTCCQKCEGYQYSKPNVGFPS